ncbi:hypothetical protein ACNSOB_06690 [Citrobacter braakii]|uniref:hypothetical protein n=1 Tax=Citrobacter braakii TaxID=57706 RepID=UPI003AB178EB
MTALNKQAYRADGGDIGIGRLKEIADNAYGDEEKRWLAQRVLALLDELEKTQKGEKQWREVVDAFCVDDADWHKITTSNNELISFLSQALCKQVDRIAGLEAREVVVKQFDDFQIVHYGGSEDYAKGYIDCQNNYNKGLTAAGIGVKGE